MGNRHARLSLVFGLALALLLLGGCGLATAYPSDFSANVGPARVPTTGRYASGKDGPVVLGGMDSAFIAELGQPVNEFGMLQDSALPTRVLAFNHYRNTFFNGVVAVRDTPDREYEHRVMLVILSASPDQAWTQEEANTYSIAYAPADAQPVRSAPAENTRGLVGTDEVYYSATLAKEFPASAFTDESGNLVTSGTFNIQYINPSASQPNQILSCQLALGTRQTVNV